MREDGDETESFVIGITDGPSNGQGLDASRNISITASNGEEFLCSIPSAGSMEDASPSDGAGGAGGGSDGSDGGWGDSRAGDGEKSPEEILDALGSWCAYRSEDWWTYELCYKKSARQFHLEGGKAVDQYLLGNYSNSDNENMSVVKVDEAAAGGPGKYVEQKYIYGAPCELTGGNRSVDVRFICGKGSQQTTFVEAREPESCRYIFTISTPELCKHSQFQEPVSKFTTITCFPKYPDLTLAKEAETGPSCRSTNGQVCKLDGDEYTEEEIVKGSQYEPVSTVYDPSFDNTVPSEADADRIPTKAITNATLTGFEDQDDDQGADGVSIDDLLKNGGGYDYEDEQQHYY